MTAPRPIRTVPCAVTRPADRGEGTGAAVARFCGVFFISGVLLATVSGAAQGIGGEWLDHRVTGVIAGAGVCYAVDRLLRRWR